MGACSALHGEGVPETGAPTTVCEYLMPLSCTPKMVTAVHFTCTFYHNLKKRLKYLPVLPPPVNPCPPSYFLLRFTSIPVTCFKYRGLPSALRVKSKPWTGKWKVGCPSSRPSASALTDVLPQAVCVPDPPLPPDLQALARAPPTRRSSLLLTQHQPYPFGLQRFLLLNTI